jgi:hypothetical protein
MAARDNTALHAALIIFVLLTVGLSVFTYVFFRSADEAKKLQQASDAKYNQAVQQNKNLNSEVRGLRGALGWETTLSKDEIEAEVKTLPAESSVHQIWGKFVQDMSKYGEGLTNPNYQTVPDHLLNTLKSKNEQLLVAITKQRELEQQVRDVTDRETKAAKAAQEAQQQAANDLNLQIAKFEQDRAKLNQDKNSLAAQIDKFRSEVNTAKANADKDVKIAIADKEKVMRLNEFLQVELDKYRLHENFEVPDGRITSVNQKTNSVMVNLGSADGLRKQVTFSVYDQTENSATKAHKKAGIEVTRIMDEHLAEGRIIHAETNNPILPGDYVYSPVWHSGPRIHYALIGWMDIDGDGNNDREFVRNLIELNGGVVDMEQGDDGRAEGAMTVETRYLVDIKELPEKSAANMVTVRNQMRSQAAELGVKLIHVNELLSYMGWKASDKTISLGRNQGDVEGAKASAAGDSTKGARPVRTPPPRTKEGAFP